MIPFKPFLRARIELGQFSPFVNPMEITGDQTPTTPPSPSTGLKNPVKPVLVLTGLALTGISAATAYVGISYGMEKGRSDIKRALGWTVGVLGALSGLVRLVGTGAMLFMPEPGTMAGRRI
jgi:hypothetical protein